MELINNSISIYTAQKHTVEVENLLESLLARNVIEPAAYGILSALALHSFDVICRAGIVEPCKLLVEASQDSLWFEWTLEQEGFEALHTWTLTDGKSMISQLTDAFHNDMTNRTIGFDLGNPGLKHAIYIRRKQSLAGYFNTYKKIHNRV